MTSMRGYDGPMTLYAAKQREGSAFAAQKLELRAGTRLRSEAAGNFFIRSARHSTVTLFAKFRGLSTSVPRAQAV